MDFVRDLDDLKPPPRYGDIGELEAFLSKLLPHVVIEFSPLLGKRAPKVGPKERARFLRKLRRLLKSVRPYLLGLGALKGDLDFVQCKYALLEGLLREQYRAGGISVPEQQDAWAFHLALATKVARPKRHLANIAYYSEVRTALIAFSEHLVDKLVWPSLDKALSDWAKSSDARKYLQFIGQLPTLVRQFRPNAPRRLTPKLAIELAHEYRVCGGFFEQRLRLLLYLSRIAQTNPLPWDGWQRKSLKELQDLAQKNSELNLIAGLVDRHVRNALAHGVPEPLYNSAEVRFHDRERAETWRFQDFFENTRRLTFGAIALAEFESLINVCLTRRIVADLWRMVAKRPVIAGMPEGSMPKP